MNLVDKFLETATDEFGNKIDFSNVEVEGFEGTVFLDKNQADIIICYGDYMVKDYGLTAEQSLMCDSFIEYVQQKMKEHKAFVKDQINTQNSLK